MAFESPLPFVVSCYSSRAGPATPFVVRGLHSDRRRCDTGSSQTAKCVYCSGIQDIYSGTLSNCLAPLSQPSGLRHTVPRGDDCVWPIVVHMTAPSLRSPWYRVCRGCWRRLHPHDTGASARPRRMAHHRARPLEDVIS